MPSPTRLEALPERLSEEEIEDLARLARLPSWSISDCQFVAEMMPCLLARLRALEDVASTARLVVERFPDERLLAALRKTGHMPAKRNPIAPTPETPEGGER